MTLTPDELLAICASARCPACEWERHIDVDIDAFDMPPRPDHTDECPRGPVDRARRMHAFWANATVMQLNVTAMPASERCLPTGD